MRNPAEQHDKTDPDTEDAGGYTEGVESGDKGFLASHASDVVHVLGSLSSGGYTDE